MDWLVGRWEWPGAMLFTAITITLLLPVWYADAGILTVLVVLQLPLYMFHQYEEHHGNRFVTYFNRVVGDGYEVLTPMSAFLINSIGVWGVILAGIVLYRFVAPGYGTIATGLVLVNFLGHAQLALRRRECNPGLWTALFLLRKRRPAPSSPSPYIPPSSCTAIAVKSRYRSGRPQIL